MRVRKPFYFFLVAALSLGGSVLGQSDDPRKDTADLIREVDDLLQSLGDDFPDDSGSDTTPTPAPTRDVQPPAQEGVEPYRADQILMPPALHEKVTHKDPEPKPEPEPVEYPKTSSGLAIGAVATNPLDTLTTEELKMVFKQMSYEQLLEYVETIDQDNLRPGGVSAGGGRVDLLGAPTTSPPSTTVQPIPDPTDPAGSSTTKPRTPIQVTPAGQAPLIVTQTSPGDDSGDKPAANVKEYIVFDDDRIDEDLSELIREAIMETRMSHSGTNYPAPSASIKKAESYCNKVLFRLSRPEHKQYRRDVLLALILMFENSEMLVEAAKSIERFLEEFANNPKYPFENGEEMPTIAEMHLRLGKIYRRMGAFRLAVNKFYDAINATLIVPKHRAFEFKHLSDAAMLEIAETYLEMEDYANAIKFFSRLLNKTNLNEIVEGNVRFKHAYSHYQRAAFNRQREARLKLKQDPDKGINPEEEKIEYEPGTSPKYDWDRVELALRDFASIYEDSHYVPESHYLLALTYHQQHKPDKALVQVAKLLSSSPYHPAKIKQQDDILPIKTTAHLKEMAEKIALWNFWKKKTGNYLGNKFFDDGDYFRAKEVYETLVHIDEDPRWEIPLLYQIGLCNERLGNVGDARRIYEDLEATPPEKITSDNVKFVINMANRFEMGMAERYPNIQRWHAMFSARPCAEA